MAKPAPTAEQSKIVAAAMTGQNLVIEAGAGSGKTSTLRMIADALAPKTGLYMAYNKAIQTEASASFPGNVECRTAHSLAYGEFGRPNARRLNGKRMFAWQAAKILNIAPLHMAQDGERITLQPKQIAVLVRESIEKFCNSADKHPTAKHVAKALGVTNFNEENRNKVINHTQPYVKAAWGDITNSYGKLMTPFFSHDCYLKMWTLTDPQIGVDFILFDEAQDANPAIAYVVEIQRAQQIMVGDRAQAIYGWRGAVDAMANFKATERHALTQSFRFGQAVADQANRWLAQVGTPLRIKGFDKIDSEVTTIEAPNAVLCRTNAGVIESAMSLMAAGKKVAIVGGTSAISSFCKAAQKLMDGQGTEHADLAMFEDWSDVQAAVKAGDANDLKLLVTLIDHYGVEPILEVCNNSTKSEDADVIISTAHKAKGLEWDSVRIHGDFQPSKEGTISVTEAMLIYVAVTRAKLHLDVNALAWLDSIERGL